MEKNESTICLKSVTNSDIEFLFDLLKERDPSTNISHKKMPTYDEHIEFVNSNPYSKWYIIEIDNEKVGSIYLTKQNEIGVHIFQKFEEIKTYQNVVKEFISKYPENQFLINISPKNKLYIDFTEELGFKLVRYTFERDESS